MNFRSRSLSFQLTVLFSVVTAILFVSFWAISYEIVSQRLKTQDLHLMKDRLRTVRALLEEETKRPERLKRRVEQEWATREFDRIYVRINNPDGTVLTETPGIEGLHIFDHAPLNDITTGRLTRFDVDTLTLVGTRLTVRNSDQPAGEKPYIVEIAFDRTSEVDLLKTLREVLLALTLIGIAICVVCARLFAAKALEPVRQISATAAEISSASLKDRIDPSSLPTEFNELAVTLNKMLNRLEEGFDRLSRFSADMAHELRTPVNNMLGSFGVTLSQTRTPEEYSQTIESGVEDCERLKRIIDSLLFIARSNNPQHEVHLQELSLKDELVEIVGFYEASADEAQLSIELDIDEDKKILAEKTLLQRAVGNLISNAIRHSPPQAKIKVQVNSHDRRAYIRVVDEGTGIDEALIPQIGERFFRADTSRSSALGGTGLGLSIVKVIAKIHGGHFALTSRLGEGTSVQLDFALSTVESPKWSAGVCPESNSLEFRDRPTDG